MSRSSHSSRSSEKRLSDDSGYYSEGKLDREPIIGALAYGSGVRKNKANRRMDWALIETPKTYKENIPAPANAFSYSDEALETKTAIITYMDDPTRRIRGFGNMKQGDWVVKSGRTSRHTAGEVGRMQMEVKWEGYNNLITREVEVHGLGNNFAEHGDSGSWVTDEDGNLVGLLIARCPEASNYDIGIVTPIQDIADDVLEFLKGELVLP